MIKKEKGFDSSANDLKHQKVKTQTLKKNVENLASKYGISKSKAQIKAYWINV